LFADDCEDRFCAYLLVEMDNQASDPRITGKGEPKPLKPLNWEEAYDFDRL
jgi:hypothetical protein